MTGREEVSVLLSPHWITIFLAIAVVASLVPFFAGFMFGLSVSHDRVFGVYALISGVLADCLIRWRFRRLLLLFTRPRVPFVVLWIVLCLYVIVFTPLE
jgi:hypothetical protein